jgi:putative hydrolase of the HAD superfamily
MEHLSRLGVRAIFFDAVGTLIHPEPPVSEAYATVGRRFGSSLSSPIIQDRFQIAFQREEDADRASQWRTSEAREELRWRRIVAGVLTDVADGEACFAELFAHFARPESWRCDPAVEKVLHELTEDGYVLGMASNVDTRLRRVVAGLPELRQLRHLVISSEVGCRKPAAAFFQTIAQVVELPLASILYVGDDPDSDYEGARAAGMGALVFDPTTDQPVDAANRIRRLEEIIEWIDRANSDSAWA